MTTKPDNSWAYYLFLFILTLIFFHSLLLHPGQILNTLDAISSNMFHENTLLRSLAGSGQFPLWSNYHFSGLPLIGNPVIQFFYPLNLLSFLFSPNLFISYSFLLHVFFAGLFTFLFCRKLGLGKFSSLISAITFMFSAVVVGKIYPGHLGSLITIALTPLLFYLLECLILAPNLRNSVLLGLFWSLQMLGGMPQLFYLSALALALYLVIRLFFLLGKETKPGALLKPILFAGLGLVICILLSAVYLLPVLNLSAQSGRAGGLDFNTASHMSLDPRQLVTLFVPGFFGTVSDNTYWGSWENPWATYLYVGIVPLLLALFGIIFRRNRYTLTFLIIGVSALIFAMGRYTPIYRLAYNLVPGISLFRVPAEALFLFCFSLAVLAGYGLSALTTQVAAVQYHNQKRLIRLLAVLAVFAIIATIALFAGKSSLMSYGLSLARERYIALHPGGTDFEQRYLPKMEVVYGHISFGVLWFSFIYIAGLILIWLRTERNLNQRVFALVITLLIVMDLWAFILPTVSTRTLDSIYPKTELFSLLANDSSKFRVLDLAHYIPQNALSKYGIESVTGYDPLLLRDYLLFTNLAGNISATSAAEENLLTNIPLERLNISELTSPKILDMLDVKYIISQEPINSSRYRLLLEQADYMPEKDFDPFKYYSNLTLPLYVYQNRKILPRAFIVGEARTIADRQQILSEIQNSTFNPGTTVLLEKALDKPLSQGSELRRAFITYYSPNKILLEADIDEPGMLFLSEVWQPGWKAIDNGNQTEVYRADYIFRAIYLPAGVHKIELYYEPISFTLGAIISALTLLFITCILLFYRPAK